MIFTHRGKSEWLAQDLSSEKNIRGMVVRLSPTVHGAGDWGFVRMLADYGTKNGFVTTIGDGSTRWPAVHRYDAATLFRLAIENGKAGAIYHAAAEEVKTGDMMKKISEKLNLPVESKTQQEAMQTIGFFAIPVGSDNPISSEKTQKDLGWKPSNPDLLNDIEKNYNF